MSECLFVYICISFVFVSCVSKIVSFCANHNDLAVLRPFYCDKLTPIARQLNFGLTRTLRTQDSIEANADEHKAELETMLRESVRVCVCERRRSGERGIKGEWTAAFGGNKRFGFNFFTFEIFIFLL